MKHLFKHVMPVALVLALAVGSVAQAFAVVGVIDYDKLMQSYNKAQAFNDDSKIKERELEKLRAEYVKQLRETKANQPNNPVALDQLQKDLEGKLNAKLNEVRDWSVAKAKEIDTEVNGVISQVAAGKKLDIVIAKQFVFMGGVDITNDVISRLNAGK